MFLGRTCLVPQFKRVDPASIKISRRDALKGLGAVGALPLLAPMKAQERQDHGVEVTTYSGSTRELLFDLGWRFHRGDAVSAEDPDFNDSTWRTVDLPHDWSIEDLTPTTEAGEETIWVGGNTPTRIGPFDVALSAGQEATGWVVGGTGWYRKRFRLALENEKSQAEVRFDGVYMNSEVWINGHSL